MNYVVVIKELSSGSIEKNITNYDDHNTALRKFHEAFNVIGGGPKRITSMLMVDMEDSLNNTMACIVEKNETWTLQEEPTPEETPTE